MPLHGLTSDDLVRLASERLPAGAGAARSVYRQVVQQGRFAPSELGLSARSVRAWHDRFHLPLPELARVVDEEDAALGTTAKAVFRLPDGTEYETVLIPMGRERYTLCISSQVGCKMGCRFCETGRMGLLRNLSADEIVAQVLLARHRLGWPVRNIVFMGMGEALDNFEGVSQALRVLADPGGLAISQERLTVCTVGHIEGIRRLAGLGMRRLNLSVSLNATTDATRDDLMPINRRAPLAELQQALASYRPRRNFALGVNYCLMPGINDDREDAHRIAEFCGPLPRVMVSVIPYNPGRQPLTRAPTPDEVDRFIGWLRDEGLPVRRRKTKGRSVMAACGQLGNPELRRTVDVKRLKRPGQGARPPGS